MLERLRALLDQVSLTMAAVRAVISDPRTPRWRRLVLLAGLAYLASPIDLIPDFIPVIGWADDAVVVFLLLWIIRLPLPEETP